MDNKRNRILRGIAMTMILMLPDTKVKGEISNIIPNNLKDMSYQEMNDIGCTTSNVNFRIGPGIDYDKILTINKGTKVEILAKMENGWYLVNFHDNLGFISSDYVRVIDMNKINEEVMNLPTVIKVLEATANVNIRENPNTNSKIITKLLKGEKIIPLELENDWYKCSLDNNICYVSSKYVKETYMINGDYKKIIYCKNDSYLYDYPYSNIIETIPQYEISKVYGEVDNFYLVECENKIGYLRKDECEKLNNKFIVVDISSQKLILFDDTDIILKSKVVTGKNSTPTTLGEYSIKSKEKNRILRGPDYETFVNYWMAFNGGQGFHDASWRHKFGGDIYIKHGSHGCVNLPKDFAPSLYENISVGDKVLIKY